MKYIEKLENIISNNYGIYGLDSLRIKKNLNSIKTLGSYNPNTKTIHINKKIFKVNKKKYRKIILHEYAHFIVDLLYDNSDGDVSKVTTYSNFRTGSALTTENAPAGF